MLLWTNLVGTIIAFKVVFRSSVLRSTIAAELERAAIAVNLYMVVVIHSEGLLLLLLERSALVVDSIAPDSIIVKVLAVAASIAAAASVAIQVGRHRSAPSWRATGTKTQ